MEGKDNLLQTAAKALLTAALVAVGQLCCKGTFLAHVQIVVYDDPSLFLGSCFPNSCAPACIGTWGYSSPVLNFTFLFVEHHKIPVCSFLQPDKLHMNGSRKNISVSAVPLQFSIIWKLAEGNALCPSSESFVKQ